MHSFNTIEDILMFAIGAEQEAADFYLRLSGQAESTVMKQVFRQYAHEELGHKTKLMKIREKGFAEISTEQIKDMKISDYTVDVVPGPSMSYTEVLALAMKKEKAAFRLYLDLASKASTEETSALFNSLAMEEAKHKLRFELEYDRQIQKGE
jgi:rubrerythrin